MAVEVRTSKMNDVVNDMTAPWSAWGAGRLAGATAALFAGGGAPGASRGIKTSIIRCRNTGQRGQYKSFRDHNDHDLQPQAAPLPAPL